MLAGRLLLTAAEGGGRREERGGGGETAACWSHSDTYASLTVSIAGEAIDLVQPGVRFAHGVELWISKRALLSQSKDRQLSKMCRRFMFPFFKGKIYTTVI